MNYLTRNCIALTFLGASAALGAHAADTADGWNLGEKNGVSFLHSVTEAGPSVLLSCSDKVGIRAMVFLNGDDLEEATNGTNGRIFARRVSLDTDSTESRDGDWGYIRSQRQLISTKGWQGKRIYNAAITGSPVTMDIFKIGNQTFSLPAVDENFKTFNSSCDATSK